MAINKLLLSLPLLISLLEAKHFSASKQVSYDIHTGHQVDLDYLNWFEAANLASSISKV
jgi:hypothetical protein